MVKLLRWLRLGDRWVWFDLPECDPSEFKTPTWEEAVRPRPIEEAPTDDEA